MGGIDGVNLIEYLCLTYQRTEAVGKACWHEKLFAALSAKLYTGVHAIGCGRATQVDDYVEDLSSQDSDQLCLFERGYLKVPGAPRSRRKRKPFVILYKVSTNTRLGKVL